jgi:type IV secretory pathway VirB2 component (pilin)
MISSRALLMLKPKCPVCVAVAIGFGFSISTKAHLRMLLIVLCGVSLVFVATKHLRRFVT